MTIEEEQTGKPSTSIHQKIKCVFLISQKLFIIIKKEGKRECLEHLRLSHFVRMWMKYNTLWEVQQHRKKTFSIREAVSRSQSSQLEKTIIVTFFIASSESTKPLQPVVCSRMKRDMRKRRRRRRRQDAEKQAREAMLDRMRDN